MDERTVPLLEGGTTGGWAPRHAQPPLDPLLRKEGKPEPLGVRKTLKHTPNTKRAGHPPLGVVTLTPERSTVGVCTRYPGIRPE